MGVCAWCHRAEATRRVSIVKEMWDPKGGVFGDGQYVKTVLTADACESCVSTGVVESEVRGRRSPRAGTTYRVERTGPIPRTPLLREVTW